MLPQPVVFATLGGGQPATKIDEVFAWSVNDYGQANVANMASLRANTLVASALPATVVNVQCYTNFGDNGGGVFLLNPTDVSSSDDGGMVIVDAAGNRWYRQVQVGLVNVRWFGGQGDFNPNLNKPTTDDTAAFNNALAYAIANMPFVNLGRINCAGIYVPSGNYYVKGSLNSTYTAGSGILQRSGSLTIRGDGIGSSSIYACLTDGPYPVLDCTGMDDIEIVDIEIITVGNNSYLPVGKQTCNILLSECVGGANDGTHYPKLTHVRLSGNNTVATNFVSAIVQCNGDQSNWTDVRCNTQGAAAFPPVYGASIGARLPPYYVGAITSSSTTGGQTSVILNSGGQNTYNFGATYSQLSTLLAAGQVVSIRTTSDAYSSGVKGAAGNQVAYIGSWVAGTGTATLVNAAGQPVVWSHLPDAGSIVEISLIISKFQNIPRGGTDFTYATLADCEFTGSCALFLTGCYGEYHFYTTYITGTGTLTSDNSAIVWAYQDPTDEAPGLPTVNFFGCRIENQSNGGAGADLYYAYTTWAGSTSVFWSGQMGIFDPQSGSPSGACFNATGPATNPPSGPAIPYYSVELYGDAQPSKLPAPLFANVTSVGTIRGSFYCASPGSVTTCQNLDFDWKNQISPYNGNWAALAQNVAASKLGTGFYIGGGILQGNNGMATQGSNSFRISTSAGTYPAVNNASYTGGSGTQTTWSIKIPGSALINSNNGWSRKCVISLNGVLAVTTGSSNFNIQLRQGSTTVALFSSGQPAWSSTNVGGVTFEVVVQQNSGTATTGSNTAVSAEVRGQVTTPTMNVVGSIGSSFNLANDMFLDLQVNSATSNPFTVYTYTFTIE